MKKKIWIFNHFATGMHRIKSGRHYWFARNLIKQGYEPTIFCANTYHNKNEIIDTGDSKYVTYNVDDITFVFVKTKPYKGNGLKRILNMMIFSINLFQVSKEYAKIQGTPDIILASSVHPLTLVVGLKVAKRFIVPCICEIRDLWPESIVEYSNLKRNSLIAKVLYLGEKWIYENADKIIFTMEGGKDYIVDRGWDINNGGSINLDKIYHINNGVDLESFDNNYINNILEDKDLSNKETFKVIYTGSIRKANNLELILNAAKYVNENSDLNIQFIIYGDGSEREKLEKKCIDEKINNVIFKGRVDKKYIPYILKQSNLNILNYANHNIWKYGGSQNKNFEYLASGRPVLSTITMGYDIIKKYGAGITLNNQSPNTIGEAIIKVAYMDKDEYNNMCKNARKAAQNFDFKVLTNKLIEIIESL